MTVPTLENKLEDLLIRGLHDDCPAVRLKTYNVEKNPNGDRVFLIRQHPLALPLEYRQSVITAGHASLTQWIEAGIGDEYPESLRVYAERDMVRETMASIRRENKAVRNDSYRYREAREQLGQYDSDDINHKRIANRIAYYRKKVYLANKTISAQRIILLEDLLTSGTVKTPEGIRTLQVAQVASLLDMLPGSKLSLLDTGIRKELNDSRNELRDPQPNVLSRLLGSKKALSSDCVDDETDLTLQRLFRIVERLSTLRQVPLHYKSHQPIALRKQSRYYTL